MARLAALELKEEVRILLAVESGSRAWGFPSPDSDYDVRFVYVRPANWYLSIDLEEKRDVIEHPILDDIDLNGWDIRKALRLFRKTNPTLIEWIQSPIRYKTSGNFTDALNELLLTTYSCERGIYHYRSAAQATYAKYLCTPQIRLKKYFYALRPLLAVRWIEIHRTVPPIEFSRLLPLIDGDVQLSSEIATLLKAKRISSEMALSAPLPRIQGFIEAELCRLESFKPMGMDQSATNAQLDVLFRAVLMEHCKAPSS